MLQFGNFKFEKEFEADGFTKLLCPFNYKEGWPSWNLNPKDSSFYGITATVYGAVSANPSVGGVFGNGCAYFPTGNDADYILYSNNPALDITTNFTLECFFSPSKLSGERTLIHKPGVLALNFIDGTTNVTLRFVLVIGGISKILDITVPESTFYGYWHHYRCTYDGQYMRLYFDGVEKGNLAVTGLIGISTYDVYVGRNSSTGYPYKGFIDDVRLSNIVRPLIGRKTFTGKTAISGTQIQSLSRGQSTLKGKQSWSQAGWSRLEKQITMFRDGECFLSYFYFQTASGQSALRKTLHTNVGGYTKLAYFVFEAEPSQIVKDSFKVVRMPLGDLVNKGHFLYGRDYRTKNYNNAVNQEDLESQGRYGVREKLFELNFVRNPAMAVDVANYYFNSLMKVRTHIHFRIFLGGLHLEVGDHILANYPLAGLTGKLFTVTALRFLPGSGYKRQMDMVMVEAIEGQPTVS